MRALAALAVASCFVGTGCKSETAKLSDEQLVAALSGQSGASASIPRPVTDCVAFFVGIKSGEFRNAQEQERVMIDAMCVMELEGRLRSSQAGDGISVDDFRERALAERVLALAAAQQDAEAERRAAETAQRQSEKADKRNAMLAELETRRAEIAKVRDAFIAGVDPVRQACDAFDAAYNEMLEVDRANAIIAAGSPAECGFGRAFENTEDNINAVHDALMGYEMPETPGPFDRVPGIDIAELPDFEAARQAVQLRVDEMKAAVEAAR